MAECPSVGPHPVIEQVMEEYGLTPEEIPEEVPSDDDSDEPTFDPKSFKENSVLMKLRKKSKRYFHTRAFAEFDCENCDRHWPSARGWSVMDLKDRNLCVLFDQDCAKKKCMRIKAKAEPVYEDESMRRMAEFAVKKCLFRLYPAKFKSDPTRNDGLKKTSGAHHEDKCQACKSLGFNCGA